MPTSTRTRLVEGALVFFAAGALLGALFLIVGPVMLIRLFGLVALLFGLAGCVLELYALRLFDPRAYASLRARLRRHSDRAWAASESRTPLARSVVLSRRPMTAR